MAVLHDKHRLSMRRLNYVDLISYQNHYSLNLRPRRRIVHHRIILDHSHLDFKQIIAVS